MYILLACFPLWRYHRRGFCLILDELIHEITTDSAKRELSYPVFYDSRRHDRVWYDLPDPPL